MKEFFEDQIEKAIPLEQDIVDQLKLKDDLMGNIVETGDKVLYCIIETEGPTEDGGDHHLEVMRILERSLDIFAEKYTFERFAGEAPRFPVFKEKDNDGV
jgi:hypothetical protein